MNMMDIPLGTKATVLNNTGGTDFLIGEVVMRVHGHWDDADSSMFASTNNAGKATLNDWYCGEDNLEFNVEAVA